MSAPDTNIETQKIRHAPALLGIKGTMIFGAAMTLILGFIVVSNGNDDGNDDLAPADAAIVTVPAQQGN